MNDAIQFEKDGFLELTEVLQRLKLKYSSAEITAMFEVALKEAEIYAYESQKAS
jgi:hypothetical protein